MSERGTRWLLVALLVVQLGLLTGQASRVDAPRPYVERLLLRGLGPLAQGVVAVQHGFGQLGSRLESRRALWQENRELKGRVETLERQLIRLQGLKSDYDRLAAALEYAERQGEQLAVADIVYSDHASWLKTLVVQVGGSSARVNQPVVAEQGLVGRVVQVDGGYAKIQPITDRASAVGAMIERTRRQGVVRGAGAAVVELDYVPLQAEVRVGDRVVTAGIDGVYPRGLPVGTVLSVAPGGELFHHIEVAPYVDFGVLDHVYLLEAGGVPQELRGGGDEDG